MRVKIQEPQTDGRKHQSGLGFKGWQSRLSLHGDGLSGRKTLFVLPPRVKTGKRKRLNPLQWGRSNHEHLNKEEEGEIKDLLVSSWCTGGKF